MATIYQYITGNSTGDNCLILDPRERLIYPFNVGDYQEVRWGMIWSFSPVTGNRGYISTDTYTVNYTSYPPTATLPFIGLSSYNTGEGFLPSIIGGYNYIGFGTNGSYGQSIGVNNNSTNLTYQFGSQSNQAGLIITTMTGGIRVIVANYDGSNSLVINPYTGVDANVKFASLFGQRLVLASNQYQFQSFYNTASSSNVSTTYLSTGINALGANQNTLNTGYFTSGAGNTSNDIITKPNCIFIYNPMLNTRMRIHNILVERYA